MMKLCNIIGELYRDVVVLCSGDFIEFTTRKGYFIYKNILPFSMTIGIYKFLKSKDYLTLINEA